MSSLALTPTHKIRSSPKSAFSKYMRSCNSSDSTIVTNHVSNSNSIFESPASREQSMFIKESDKLYEFLCIIKMEEYFECLTHSGFDDFESLVKQMSTPLPLTQETLKDIGINKPGHQNRILFMLEKAINNLELGNFGEIDSFIIETSI